MVSENEYCWETALLFNSIRTLKNQWRDFLLFDVSSVPSFHLAVHFFTRIKKLHKWMEWKAWSHLETVFVGVRNGWNHMPVEKTWRRFLIGVIALKHWRCCSFFQAQRMIVADWIESLVNVNCRQWKWSGMDQYQAGTIYIFFCIRTNFHILD